MPGDADRPVVGNDDDGSAFKALVEVAVIVGVAVGLALTIQAFLVKPYRIPSGSMLPTLEIGERILVNRVEGRFGTPARGDILVFDPPAGLDEPACGVKDGEEYEPGKVYRDGSEEFSDQKMPCPVPAAGKYEDTYVKRLVAMPGETVAVKRGHVYVNGKKLDEPYIAAGNNCENDTDLASDCNFPTPITVPANHYFMMGDNRNDGESYDSRFWGPVARESVIGNVFLTYWPLQRVGTK